MTKRILSYLGWLVVTILLGLFHIRIVLGPAPESDHTKFSLSSMVYN